MSEYKYRNKFERERTQKYEGVYAPKETELNRKLLEECQKPSVDFALVEELLRQGADPLGGTEPFGCSLLDHIYGKIVAWQWHDDSRYLPRITELFIKYGMDIDHPRIPYDHGESLNPMWSFAFTTNENATLSMKMILDKGISVDSFGEFWGHSIGDLVDVECGDPVNDEFWNETCVWTLKMLMLGASYDDILENDKDLQKFIDCKRNRYDIHNFRDWSRYRYEFDTSRCDKKPALYKSVVHIFDTNTNQEVWKFGVYAEEES